MKETKEIELAWKSPQRNDDSLMGCHGDIDRLVKHCVSLNDQHSAIRITVIVRVEKER